MQAIQEVESLAFLLLLISPTWTSATTARMFYLICIYLKNETILDTTPYHNLLFVIACVRPKHISL
jgi:hypothetical protein